MSEAVSPPPSDPRDLVVAVLGGTGDQGHGLALRFAAAGIRVVVGSRDAGRAQAAADRINGVLDGAVDGAARASGDTNDAAARQADIVVVAVPWEGHQATLESLRDALAGKIVVDCVNPMGFDKKGAYALVVPEGSAAEQAAALLPDSRVVAAFHHVSAVLLADETLPPVECDVLVLGDDRAATDRVQQLAETIAGVHGVYGGRLRNAHQVEALTANLVSINRRYKVHAGLRVTDI